jgi:hypothetical protein
MKVFTRPLSSEERASPSAENAETATAPAAAEGRPMLSNAASQKNSDSFHSFDQAFEPVTSLGKYSYLAAAAAACDVTYE